MKETYYYFKMLMLAMILSEAVSIMCGPAYNKKEFEYFNYDFNILINKNVVLGDT